MPSSRYSALQEKVNADLAALVADATSRNDWTYVRSFFAHPVQNTPDAEKICKVMAWGRFFLPTYLRDASPPFHYEILEKIFSRKNEYWAAPRGFSKTTLNQLAMCYKVANQEEKFIVVVEKSFREAAEVLEMVRKTFADERMVKQVYGCLIKADATGATDEKNKDAQGDLFINGVRLRAKGFNAPIRGLKSAEWRPTLIIVDDVETDEHIGNEDQRRKYRENYSQGIVPSLDIDGCVKVMGTILHYDSLLKNLVDHHGGSIYRAYDPMAQEPASTLLWPERWPWDVLERKRLEMEMEGQGSSKFCSPFEAPVLMSDMSLKHIGEVEIGDELVGFEFGNGKRRTLKKSKVLDVFSRSAKTVRITLSNGDIIRCTPEHRWFTGRWGEHRSPYLPAVVGRRLMKVFSLPREATDEERLDFRYLAGMIDGEGACKWGNIQISQSKSKNPDVYSEIEAILKKLNIPFTKQGPFDTKQTETFVIGGGKSTKIEIIHHGKLAKQRQLADWMFKRPTDYVQEKPRVVKIEDSGEETVYSLKTETGNYIVWGYASSNCQEFLNQPIDDLRRDFRQEWTRKYFTEADVKFKALYRTVCIDPAESKSRGADYTAVTVVDTDQENNWFVRHVKRHRVNSAELIDLIFELWRTFSPQTIGIEKKAFEDQIKPYLQIKSQETGVFPAVVELEHKGQRKEDRIRGALQGRFESGKIYLMEGAKDDTRLLQGELYDFPFGKNDDLADSLAYHSVLAKRPYGGRTEHMPSNWKELLDFRKKKRGDSLAVKL